MSEDVTRGGQKLVARSHCSADFELKNVQIDVAEDPILRKRDESVNYCVSKDVSSRLRVIPNVCNQLIVRHDVTTVTDPTSPVVIKACPRMYGRMSFVFRAVPKL